MSKRDYYVSLNLTYTFNDGVSAESEEEANEIALQHLEAFLQTEEAPWVVFHESELNDGYAQPADGGNE